MGLHSLLSSFSAGITTLAIGLDESLNSIYFFDQINDMAMWRAVSAVHATLVSAYPFEMKNAGLRRTFKILSYTVPLLVACNDYCDIGLPASRKSMTVEENRRGYLIDLHDALREELDNKINRLISIRTNDVEDSGKIRPIENYVSEMIVLGNYAPIVGNETFLSFMEADSALPIVLAVQMTIPSILENKCIDNYTTAKSFSQILEKYEVFIGNSNLDEHRVYDPKIATLQSLHAIEMLLKIDDDKLGANEDNILGNPSFVRFMSSNDPIQIQNTLLQLEEAYKTVAYKGSSEYLVGIGRYLFCLTFALKYRLTKLKQRKLDMSEVGDFVRSAGSSNTLREQLYHSGALEQLFA